MNVISYFAEVASTVGTEVSRTEYPTVTQGTCHVRSTVDAVRGGGGGGGIAKSDNNDKKLQLQDR